MPGLSQRRSLRNTQQQPDSNDERDGEGDVDMDQDLRLGGESDIKRKANDLVRLALFTEQKRMPLRREDITKKVLSSNTRSFNVVFEHAQDILRKTFGMELVELRSRTELEKPAPAPSSTQDPDGDALMATGIKKKAAAGSKTYILRSILHPIIIEHASLADEQILEEEVAALPDDDDDDDIGPRSYGSIISWSHADQLAPIGLLHVILALILVSGRVMNDMDLRANLKRLRLPGTATIAFNAQSTHRSLPLDTYLTTLVRQGYLDRQRVGDAKGASAGGAKRGRAATQVSTNDDSGAPWLWLWGSRAQKEIGETGVGKFVAEFMVERMGEADEEEEDGEEGRGAKGRGTAKGKRKAKDQETEVGKKLAGMMKGIERAAGGNLTDLR